MTIMINRPLSHHLAKTTIIFSFICLFTINTAIAGICDISGGSGIGGTGAPMHGSGIGGTGAIAHGSGIGGTGKPIKKTGTGLGGSGFVINGSGIGGTGQAVTQNGHIVGTITGFGSICVNGIEIHYTSDTPLQRDGQSVSPDNSLAIGQVVSVGVSGSGNEVTAKEMHIIHAATGPISTIDFVKGEIEVLGQKVNFAINSIPSNELNNLQAGDYIEVSGLRDSVGNIMASRIDTITKQKTASLHGQVTSISNNSFAIQGIKINSPAPTGIAIGQALHVSGKVDIEGFKAAGLIINPQPTLSADIGGLVSVEGYIDNLDNSAKIEVAGRVINIPVELQAEVKQVPEHDRVIVTGRLAEGSIIQLEHMIIDIPVPDIEDSHHEIENETHSKDEHDERDTDEFKQNSDIDKHKDELEELNDQKELESHESKDHDGGEFESHEHDEVPELETPEASEHETPETPEIADIESHETHEFETPEVPEVESHDTPEFEAPEVHEHEAPEMPEFEAPEVHEHEAPEMPEFEAPEVHEHEAPEMPEFEAPEVHEHEAPEMPEFEAPEMPEVEVPETHD